MEQDLLENLQKLQLTKEEEEDIIISMGTKGFGEYALAEWTGVYSFGTKETTFPATTIKPMRPGVGNFYHLEKQRHANFKFRIELVFLIIYCSVAGK